MSLRIEIKNNPEDADYQAIVAPLRAYNQAQAGVEVAEKVALLINDESEPLKAACTAGFSGIGCSSSYWSCRNPREAKGLARS